MSSKQKETTISQRKIILHMHNQGKSYAEIGEMMDRSRFTIRNIIKRFKGASCLKSAERTGRPQVLSDREKQHIVRKVKKDPKISSTQIAAEVKNEFGKDIHAMTVRRVLHSAGYNSRVARKKPLISSRNQKKRLDYAKEYNTKPNTFWDQVLFSDESKYNIFRSDGRTSVWRKPNTEFEKQNLAPTVKYGGGGVMVWGCMAAAGVGELVFIEDIMDKTVYLNILKQNLKKSAQKLNLPSSFTFQQDNDPKHSAHIVRMWLTYNTAHVLPHPPQSPDLNPIEHLWEELERRVRKRAVCNKMELKQALLEEWHKITQQTTQKLVNSMPRRLEAVIKQNGLPTKY
uniref:Transposable element Tc1 transposase n=1 Tax=Bactrocera dorsalis TaxID=27457 RepID=A0A034VZC4_BACDO